MSNNKIALQPTAKMRAAAVLLAFLTAPPQLRADDRVETAIRAHEALRGGEIGGHFDRHVRVDELEFGVDQALALFEPTAAVRHAGLDHHDVGFRLLRGGRLGQTERVGDRTVGDAGVAERHEKPGSLRADLQRNDLARHHLFEEFLGVTFVLNTNDEKVARILARPQTGATTGRISRLSREPHLVLNKLTLFNSNNNVATVASEQCGSKNSPVKGGAERLWQKSHAP